MGVNIPTRREAGLGGFSMRFYALVHCAKPIAEMLWNPPDHQGTRFLPTWVILGATVANPLLGQLAGHCAVVRCL